MSLVVGNTYEITLVGSTAPQGYEQFEEFINFPNTIFQILDVVTNYSAISSAAISNPHDNLYGDACGWENDPDSPNYLECLGDGKVGGINVTTVYTVKILSGGGTTETLNTLLYDFSGSSFHYNADFSTGARFANIIDPALVVISKNFGPNPTNVNGVSTLTFTINNPNDAVVDGLNFVDNLPTSPGAMVVDDPPGATTSGCGTPTFAPGAGDASLAFSGGTVAASGICTVKVNVTMPVTGTYNNDSENLFIDLIDSSDDALASLVVNTTPVPPPPPSSCPGQEIILASWSMETSQGTVTPPAPFYQAADVATASATYVALAGSQAVGAVAGTTANSWGATATGTGTNGWAETPTSMGHYFQFELDTSKYGGVRATFDVALLANGDWANPTSNIYVNTSADGGGFTLYTPTATAGKGSWTTGLVADAAATGTSTTTFRINTDGASKAAATLNLDNIVFTGCANPGPPTITKSFSPDPVAVNGVSTLTFTLTNPNTTGLTGVEFLDNLPAGLEVAATSNAATTCTGSPTWAPAPTTTALAFGQATGANLAAGSSCTVSVDIKATTAGPHDNVSGFISATESGMNDSATGTAAASLFAVSPPSISKVFESNPIVAGGVSTLTFSITNPNQNNVLSGVAFADTFPSTADGAPAPGNMVVAPSPNVSYSGCGPGVFAALTGGESAINFSGATIAAGSTCFASVDITAPTVSADPTDTYNNVSGPVTHLINAVAVGTDTGGDALLVNGPNPAISLLKQVSTSAAGPWTSYLALDLATYPSVYYRFTVENTGDVPLDPVTVTDPDPVVSAKLAGCSWSALPVADALDYDHVQTCVTAAVAAVSGAQVNTATAHGTYSGTVYDSAESEATYVTIGVALVKSAAQNYFTAAGETINYSYVVSNSGSAVLGGVATVADDKATVSCPSFTTAVLKSDGTTGGDGDNYLDTNEQITCTAAYSVTAADVTAKSITNVASATISGVTSPTDTVTVQLVADLSAVKTNNVSGTVAMGNTFDWTFLVGNKTSAGPATFTDTQEILKDELPTSGATYAVGTARKAGATGTISCAIVANVLTCSASGSVTIPTALTGTLAVTKDSAAVVGTTTAFTTQLTPGSIISIAGMAYMVLAIADDTHLTLLTDYAGDTDSGLVVPGSFNVPVTVTPSGAGSLVNPRSGGLCRADPAAVLTEIDETDNDCADTVTVTLAPSLLIVKAVQPYSDPINGTTSPKAIPGAFMDYTILITNTGFGTVDNNTMVITDPLPANTELFVGDITGVVDTGPVLFTDGATASGLSYTYTTLNNLADSPAFSRDGTDYSKDDFTADVNQCDTSVTHLKVTMGGMFAASDGTNNPSFSLKFRVRVK
jgi:uncharacterized repeat protein (TIGR01451 family)